MRSVVEMSAVRQNFLISAPLPKILTQLSACGGLGRLLKSMVEKRFLSEVMSFFQRWQTIWTAISSMKLR